MIVRYFWVLSKKSCTKILLLKFAKRLFLVSQLGQIPSTPQRSLLQLNYFFSLSISKPLSTGYKTITFCGMNTILHLSHFIISVMLNRFALIILCLLATPAFSIPFPLGSLFGISSIFRRPGFSRDNRNEALHQSHRIDVQTSNNNADLGTGEPASIRSYFIIKTFISFYLI